MADITYIPIRQLYPHPDNPRKELGDLSELAASIKENGVYQNLTVIPGHYLNSREYIAKCVDEGGDSAAFNGKLLDGTGVFVKFHCHILQMPV